MDHPRRLDELVGLLEDRDVILRERAAAAVARLAESCPERLLRIVERMKAALSDDSAYVRWHLAYVLGQIGASFPNRAPRFLAELSARLDDENRLVRLFATKAIERIAGERPQVVVEAFRAAKREAPYSIARHLPKQL